MPTAILKEQAAPRRGDCRISARSQGHHQALSRRRGAGRCQSSDQAGHGACADGRERRRQIDADEDHRRHLSRRTRARSACAASRCRFHSPLDATRARHRHDPSGAQPDAVHDGRREHLDPAASRKNRFGLVDHGELQPARPSELFEALNIDLDPERRSAALTVANRQMVEIAKAVSYEFRRPDHGRADLGPDREGGRRISSRSSATCERRAKASSTSRTR